MRFPFAAPRIKIALSEVMSALSYALDLVEGQPPGHSVRSCLIGMRVGRELGLPAAAQSSLFYALLMKDLGCSSNAAKMCFLFGADDRETKGAIKTVNWRNLRQQAGFALRHIAPGKPWMVRALRMAGVLAAGQRAGKELIKIRCERGAKIARLFGLGEETAMAIHFLDEHFDGGGHPSGASGEQIPLLARIMGLAQTAEVFVREQSIDAMRTMVRDRRGSWFDPELVDILLAVGDDDELWQQMSGKPEEIVHLCEPAEKLLYADDTRLDNIASGFAQVIDAKSPWTFNHSRGVAEVSVGIAKVLGLPAARVRDINRAALLHDIGKLGVSNLILDKPGKLTPGELTAMRQHPRNTHDILKRVAGFSELAELAASHHERLDGKGYHRGLSAMQLTIDARILCAADMYEALAAKRPYRDDLSSQAVMEILDKNSVSGGICPTILDALRTFIAQGTFVPYQIAA